MYSLTYRYGIPSVFLTFAPDDVGSPLVLRWAMNFSGNSSFPGQGDTYGDDFNSFFEAIMQGKSEYRDIPIANSLRNIRLKKLVTDNPAAAALVFKGVMEVVLEELLGITPEYKVKKTRALQCRKKGIFGFTPLLRYKQADTPRPCCNVGQHTSWTDAKSSLQPRHCKENYNVLDSYYTSELSAAVHVKGMLNIIH